MGLAIKELVKAKEISFDELSGKIVAVDTFNMLYQFLTTIRQQDGSLLMDSKGNVTSHLTGLFTRTMSLMQKNIKPVFVFDGEPPEIKKKERERRAQEKMSAQKEYEVAKEQQDIAGMKKYASRTARLTSDMVRQSKELIGLMGLPIVQAPSEGEAQAAFMVKQGDCYATVSQDYDSLMFGATRLVRNLSVSQRRKAGSSYQDVRPEMISLAETLNALGIDNDSLIILGILVGTDYNRGGVKGIGPAKALKLMKSNQEYEKIFGLVKWEFEASWEEIHNTIAKMPTTSDYRLEWNKPDIKGIMNLMCDKYEFSRERIESQLSKLKVQNQRGLGDFF